MACCGRGKVVRPQPSTNPTQFRTPINYSSLQPTSQPKPNNSNNLVCTCGGTLKVRSTYISGDNQKKANVVCDKCQLVRIVAL